MIKIISIKEKIKTKRIVIHIKHFNYSLYPLHFNININSGYYSWKPFVIWKTYIEYRKSVLWLDCGCFIKSKLDYEYEEINKINIYTISSRTTIERYTHKSLFVILNVNKDIYKKTMCAAGVVGIYYPSEFVSYIFNLWKACALIKNCIAPPGSNRGNHRQDQSVFSILLYQQNINFSCNKNVNFITHFDRMYRKYNDTSFKYFINSIQ